MEARVEEEQVLEELQQKFEKALEGATGDGGAVGGGTASRLAEECGLGLREADGVAEVGVGAGRDGVPWRQVAVSERRSGGGSGGLRAVGGRQALVERLRAKVEEDRKRNIVEEG